VPHYCVTFHVAFYYFPHTLNLAIDCFLLHSFKYIHHHTVSCRIVCVCGCACARARVHVSACMCVSACVFACVCAHARVCVKMEGVIKENLKSTVLFNPQSCARKK
jgi:hypothetical protein